MIGVHGSYDGQMHPALAHHSQMSHAFVDGIRSKCVPFAAVLTFRLMRKTFSLFQFAHATAKLLSRMYQMTIFIRMCE